MDAALALVSEGGPKALTIRAIAKRVGVSHMVLYTYFENHAALVAAFVERQRERMKARRVEIVRQAETGDVREALREMGIERGVVADRDPDLAAATVLSIVNAPLILHLGGRLQDEALRDQVEAETLQIAMNYQKQPSEQYTFVNSYIRPFAKRSKECSH